MSNDFIDPPKKSSFCREKLEKTGEKPKRDSILSILLIS